MPIVKVELPQVTYEQLIAIAVRERRPAHWQAEVLLIQTLAQCVEAVPPGQGAPDHADQSKQEEAKTG